jgi:Cu+-exporting ATPase
MTEEKQTITMPIEGMTCASCVAHVQRGLKKVDGVLEVNVNLATEQASVVLDPEQVPLMRLVDAVRDTGYPWRGWWTPCAIQATTCPLKTPACLLGA